MSDDDNDIERRVLAALDATGIPYAVVECDPDFADTFPFSERYGYPVAMSANTIVVASKQEPKQYVACVVLATTRVDANNTAKKWMGVLKVSFADPEETAALTGMMIGGVTPLALPADVPLLVDPAVLQKDEVIIGGGSRSMKIKVSPKVFEQLPNTHVVPGLSMPLGDR